ncbi:MAG TPA: VOC family protein [Mucilaginibacter sp.]
MNREKLYVDHVVLTVASLPETEEFYTRLFGNPDFETEDSIMFYIGSTRLFLVQQKPGETAATTFNPNVVGLEHLAFGVKTLDELVEIEKNLADKQVENSGIHMDKHSNKEKIWLNDPSGIRIEFFLRPV